MVNVKLVLALLLSIWSLESQALAEDSNYKIICNKSLGIRSLSRRDFKNIFLAEKKKMGENQEITLVKFEAGSKHEKLFVEKELNLFAPALRKKYLTKIFNGRFQEPLEVSSPEEMVRIVTQTVGAFGYVPVNTQIDLAIQVILKD